MTKTLLTVVFATVVSGSVWGGGPPDGGSARTLAVALEASVRDEWAAYRNRDKAALAQLLAPDFHGVEVDSQGTRDRGQALREVEHAVVRDYELSRFDIAPLGPDAALATYEAFIKFPPTAQVRGLRVYVSEVWVRRDGRWLALHYQETRVK
jgi:uncharacterized protein (TIGR02246 family)